MGRVVETPLKVISPPEKGDPARPGARRSGRTLESVSAANMLVDLIQYGDHADVIESDGRILMPERAARHEAEEKYACMVVEPRGHVKIGQRRAEEIMDIRDAMQNGIGIDALRDVQQRHDERHDAVIGQ